jgi:AcrR family transcriptional regulator/DNA-binding MarR family transcriptional regulator
MPSPNASEAKARQGAHVIAMQRRRLLSAMVEVLDEHGYEGATVGRICKRAGVSRRTFYDLYEEREECFLDAFDVAIERLAGKVTPAYLGEAHPQGPRRAQGAQRARDTQRAQGWRERMRVALTVLLESFDTEPGLARLCLVETLKAGPEALARRRVVTDALTAAVDEGRISKGTGAGSKGAGTSPLTKGAGSLPLTKGAGAGAKNAGPPPLTKGASPPPLTAESLVGGAIAVIYGRLVARPGAGEHDRRPLVELVNPLMSMIVLPYLGPAASRRELERSTPTPAPTGSADAPAGSGNGHALASSSGFFKDLPIRITFRTVRVLDTIGVLGGRGSDPSNREIAQHAGVTDQGQMSKLLRRLERAGLIDNHGQGQLRGEPNAWQLTERGRSLLRVVGGDIDE